MDTLISIHHVHVLHCLIIEGRSDKAISRIFHHFMIKIIIGRHLCAIPFVHLSLLTKLWTRLTLISPENVFLTVCATSLVAFTEKFFQTQVTVRMAQYLHYFNSKFGILKKSFPNPHLSST